MKRGLATESKTYDALSGVTIGFDATFGVAATPFLQSATTSAGALNQVPLGNSQVTRIGRKLIITRIKVLGYVTITANQALNFPVAIYIVRDRAPNQAATIPAWATVFNRQSAVSLLNIDGEDRFEILAERRFSLIGDFTLATPSLTNTSVKIFDIDICGSWETFFTSADATGLIPDMVRGAIYLYCVANVSGANAPLGVVDTRIYFDDE